MKNIKKPKTTDPKLEKIIESSLEVINMLLKNNINNNKGDSK
jgi:hypothetical protein